MGKLYQVVVHGIMGEKMTVDLCNTDEQFKSMTVLQLREKISEKLPAGVELSKVRLIFAADALDENTKLLSDYGIQHKSVIHMVVTLPGGMTA